MDLMVARTPEIIAIEINSIKEQTGRIVLNNSIEIGRKLVEAKELVEHGEWGAWLEKSVDYSQRTASNLMRIFEEYGSKQLSLIDNSNSQALANLSYTQAVALLSVPSEEREEFVKSNDVDSMSTRELQEAIKARDNAEKLQKETEKKLQKLEQENKKLVKSNEQFEKDNSSLTAKAKELESRITEAIDDDESDDTEELEKVRQELMDANSKVALLETKLKEKPIEVNAVPVEVVPDELKKELEQLKAKVTSGENLLKFKLSFKQFTDYYGVVTTGLDEVKSSSPDDYEKYRRALAKALETMASEVRENVQ